MNSFRRPVIVAAIALLPFVTTSARAEICPLPPEILSYAIFNDEDRVGALELTFNRGQDQTVIDVSMHLLVKLFFVTVYQFKHSSSEIWIGNGLKSLTAETDDNGDRFAITMRKTGESHDVQSNDGHSELKGIRLTELLWCEKAAVGGPIISTLTGHLNDIPIDFIDNRQVQVDQRTIPARHYRFVRKKRTGHVWYDDKGILIKLTYPTRYFSTASFVRVR